MNVFRIDIYFLISGYLFMQSYELYIIICFQMVPECQIKIQQLSQQEQHQVVTCNQRQFQLNGVKVSYQNCYMLSQLDQKITDKFQVINYLCFQQGKKIKKHIEILYQNKKIRIRDQFQFDSPKNQNLQDHESPKRQKKIQIVKKPLYTKPQQSRQKRDTKNIVKNVVKLFINWLSLENIEILHLGAKKRTIEIVHKMNFNNSMIQVFAEDSLINPVFTEFIQKDAEKFIQASKIKDKSAHKAIIQYYLGILKSKHQCNNKQPNDQVFQQI